MSAIGKYIFGLAALILGSLPGVLIRGIVRTAAVVFFLVSPRTRSNVRRNLAGIGVEPDNSAVLRILRNHVMNLVEIFTTSRWKPERIEGIIRCEGRETLDRATQNGKGAIIATAHVGNWELAALYLRSAGYGIHVVAGVQMNRLLTDAVKEAKEARGIEVVGPQHSYRRLFSALSANNFVALLLDGNIFRGGERVTFFGKEILLPRGAVRLSRRTGCPVIGAYCRRLDGKGYLFHLEMILNGGETARLPEDEALKRLYGRLEEYIRLNSDQWCMLRDFWSTVS